MEKLGREKEGEMEAEREREREKLRNIICLFDFENFQFVFKMAKKNINNFFWVQHFCDSFIK